MALTGPWFCSPIVSQFALMAHASTISTNLSIHYSFIVSRSHDVPYMHTASGISHTTSFDLLNSRPHCASAAAWPLSRGGFFKVILTAQLITVEEYCAHLQVPDKRGSGWHGFSQMSSVGREGCSHSHRAWEDSIHFS